MNNKHFLYLNKIFVYYLKIVYNISRLMFAEGHCLLNYIIEIYNISLFKT